MYVIFQPWTKFFVKIHFLYLLRSTKDFSLYFFCFLMSGETLKEARKVFTIFIVIIIIIIIITNYKFVLAFYDSKDWIRVCVTAFEQPYVRNHKLGLVNCLASLCSQLDLGNQCLSVLVRYLATMHMKLQFLQARLALSSRETNHITGGSDFCTNLSLNSVKVGPTQLTSH